MAKSYKQETMLLTGMSSQEYDKKYDVFRKKVRRWEEYTGRKESTTELFFKSFKYPKHTTIREITQLQTYTVSKEMTKQELKNLAYTTFVAFRRLIEKSPKLQSLISDVWDGHNIGDTLYVIKEYAKDLHRRQKDSGYKSGTD